MYTKETLIQAVTEKMKVTKLYSLMMNYTINELLLLFNFLDPDLNYFIDGQGKLGFQDMRGYYENEFNYIEDYPVFNMAAVNLSQVDGSTYDKIISTLMDLLDNYNHNNPKEKIIYIF